MNLTKVLSDAATRWRVPGSVLAIWHDGRLDVAVDGVLDIESKAPVTPDAMFQIGSITKVLTTSVAMRLVDRGLLDLDATVRTYLPDFRIADLAASKAVTIRQLMNHSSGLAGDLMTDTGTGPDCLARYIDRCALLPLAHPVGAGFSYSNAAFSILGRVIEVVTGLTFDQALARELIQPMGLGRTFSDPRDLVGRPASAGHVADPDAPGGARRLPTVYTLPISGGPAGSTPTLSASDLIDFARMHLDGGVAPNGARVLSQESVEAMQRPHVTIPVPARDVARWGLGWFLVDAANGHLIGHDGATVGQSAFLRIHRESGTIGVLFANGGAANDFFLDVFAQSFDQLTGVRQGPVPTPSGTVPADLEHFTGTYRTVATTTDITLEDGRLMRRATMRVDDTELAEPPVELVHWHGDHFLFVRAGTQYPTTVSFLDADADGRPAVMFTGLRVARRDR